jgi:hypothetical protein
MSASYVRNMVEAWLKDPAVVTPFYPTINLEQNPADPIWITAEFNPSYRTTTTFCAGDILEEGEIEIIFFGSPGVGYGPVLAALEADMATLMAMRDPAYKFVLMELSAPNEFSRGDADKKFAMSVYADYTYYL